MKVLITGAAGRIAQWIIPFLEKEYDLHLTDQRAAEINGRVIHALDITDYQAVAHAMEGMDAVVHLAIASSRHIVTDLELFASNQGEEYRRFNELSIEVNVKGTYNILEAARQHGVKRVVLGSSLTIVLGPPAYSQIDDATPARPANLYAVTKLCGENLGELYSRQFGLTVYCLRFGTPYPQPEHPYFEQWMSKPFGRGSWVSFRDMANAVRCAISTSSGPAFGSYIIVSKVKDSRYHSVQAEEIGWHPEVLEKDESLASPAIG